MGKLFGRIFKEDIKSTILWLIIPLVFAIVFSQLLNIFGENPLVILGLGITVMLVIVGPFIALISVAVNDYDRFYGDFASLYSQLPIKSGSIIGARFFNYLCMAVIASITAVVNFFLIFYLVTVAPFTLNELFDAMNRVFSTISTSNKVFMVFYMLIMAITSIFQVMFAITAGSSGLFGKASKGKVVLLYIILSLALGLLFTFIQKNAYINYTNLEDMAVNIEVGVNKAYISLISPMIFNIIAAALMAYGSYYFHDKKLSVA